MMSSSTSENGITLLLAPAVGGDATARDQLISLIYNDLRRRAGMLLGHDGMQRHIRPTELVNETYLKLFNGEAKPDWANRAEFFAAASKCMRDIVIDLARSKQALKRGGGRPALSLEACDLGNSRRPMDLSDSDITPGDVLDVHEALAKLETIAPRQARVAEMRFFSDMTGEAIAVVLDLSPRQVDSDFRLARAWLAGELGKGSIPV